MAKLMKMFTMSMGGGLVLGAVLHALENRVAEPKTAHQGRLEGPDSVSERNNVIPMRRVRALPEPASDPAGHTEREPAANQQVSETPSSDGLDLILTRLSGAENHLQELFRFSEATGLELREYVTAQVRNSMAETEARLSSNMDADRSEVLGTLGEGVSVRVAERVAQLEEELVAQSSAIVELRDFSERTQQSIGRLLEGIERLAAAQTEVLRKQAARNIALVPQVLTPEQTTADRTPASASVLSILNGSVPEAEEEKPRRRLWRLFG